MSAAPGVRGFSAPFYSAQCFKQKFKLAPTSFNASGLCSDAASFFVHISGAETCFNC